MDHLTQGIYDNLLDDKLEQLIDQIDQNRQIIRLSALNENLTPDYLTRTLAEHIKNSLRIISGEKRYSLANLLIQTLAEFDEDLNFLDEHQLSFKKENLLTEISTANSPSASPHFSLVPREAHSSEKS